MCRARPLGLTPQRGFPYYPVMQFFILALISFGVAVLGTVIGAGGGFLLMPILIFLYPGASAETVTFISLFAVLANAASATVSYGRMRRIDLRSGLLFGACTVPLAVAGRLALKGVSRAHFEPVFGGLLILVAALLFRTVLRKDKLAKGVESKPPRKRKVRRTRRAFVDASGIEHHYAFHLPLGLGFSGLVGFVSSFFGIGGGIIHVPFMTQALKFPVHVATATSILVLLMSALTGVATHLVTVRAGDGLYLGLVAGLGALVGGQFGARLSKKVSGKRILLLLAGALMLVGWRLLLRFLMG